MFNTKISYPTKDEEQEIVQRTTSIMEPQVNPIIDGSRVLEIQDLVRQVPVADNVVDYAIRIVRATRVGDEDLSSPGVVQQYVRWGAGPRASQYLVLAAKGRALLNGCSVASCSDIRSVASPVLRHRILRNFNAEADGIQTDQIIKELLEWVDEDGTDPETARQLDKSCVKSGRRWSFMQNPDQPPDSRGAESYLAPETLLQLSTFELRAKMIVEGVRSGLHASPHQGMSVEFNQHRPYTAGDDIRHLDWKVYGRSDRLTIKQYEQETTLDVILMVDCSASMRFGSMETKEGWGGTDGSRTSRRWTKFDHATATATALAWMSLQNTDRVGVHLFAEGLENSITQRSSESQWRQVVSLLSRQAVEKGTDINTSVDQVLALVSNRSLFIILSDFLEDPAVLRSTFAKFHHKRHDLICIQGA